MATVLGHTTYPGNNTTSLNITDAELLHEAYERMLMEYLPVIIWMCFICVVGIVGNVLTIIFYMGLDKRTSTIVLIIYLAWFDLAVCFLCTITIADLCVNVYFDNVPACKIMYFADHWIVVTSVLILWLISIDRYRKICHPFGRQFTKRSATISVWVMCLASLVVAVRDFFTYAPIKLQFSTKHPGVYVEGYYCTNSDEESLHLTIMIFLIFDILMIFSVLVTFVYTYGKIWLVLRKHNKRREKLMIKSPSSGILQNNPTSQQGDASVGSEFEPTNKSNGLNTGKTSRPVFNLESEKAEPDSMQFKLPEATNSSRVSIQSEKKCSSGNIRLIASESSMTSAEEKKKAKQAKNENRLTIMMLAVSVGFVICFMPYFLITVGVRLVTKTTEGEMSALIQFAIRSPFWNSVINPFIFCIFNSQYRNYVKSLLTTCKIKINSFTDYTVNSKSNDAC